MKLLVEWDSVLLALLSSRVGTLVITGVASALFVYGGETDTSVELSDLVGVLAGGWYFNRSRPVEVEVTERES